MGEKNDKKQKGAIDWEKLLEHQTQRLLAAKSTVFAQQVEIMRSRPLLLEKGAGKAGIVVPRDILGTPFHLYAEGPRPLGEIPRMSPEPEPEPDPDPDPYRDIKRQKDLENKKRMEWLGATLTTYTIKTHLTQEEIEELKKEPKGGFIFIDPEEEPSFAIQTKNIFEQEDFPDDAYRALMESAGKPQREYKGYWSKEGVERIYGKTGTPQKLERRCGNVLNKRDKEIRAEGKVVFSTDPSARRGYAVPNEYGNGEPVVIVEGEVAGLRPKEMPDDTLEALLKRLNFDNPLKSL